MSKGKISAKQREILEQAMELLGQKALGLVQAGDGEAYKEAVKKAQKHKRILLFHFNFYAL